MATLNFRLDDKLKNAAYEVLHGLDVTPTEAVRLFFQYIAENKKLPIKNLVISNEDQELIEIIKDRMANPMQGIEVNLDDL